MIFPIVSAHGQTGSGAVAAGSVVRLLLVDAPTRNVTVAYPFYGNSPQRVALQKTDLRERAAAEMAKAESTEKTVPLAGAPTLAVTAATEVGPASSDTLPSPSGAPTELLDHLVLGDDKSEQAHQLTADHSETSKGALGAPARKLLPREGGDWQGGKLTFTMKVDSQVQNYLTASFWGSESDRNLLVLFCEGKQVGYRHLGDVDILAMSDDAPRYPGRFYYVTTPLPHSLTTGRTELHFEIRSTGPINGYASSFEQYQKPMIAPTRSIYRLYTHTDGCFVPPADENQGEAPQSTKRSSPGPEVMNQVKERLNGMLTGIMRSDKPTDQMRLQFLANAYFVKWSVACNQTAAVNQIVKGVDNYYVRWKTDPDGVWNDKSTYNPGWVGVGPAADAVRMLAKPLAPFLDEELPGGKRRRDAWSELFKWSFEKLRRERKWLTNQAMFSDVNIYRCNRALEAIDPKTAVPEEVALHYLYESIGLLPWLGPDTDHGPEKSFGSDFYQVTEKGLTRELGYSGGYGEGGCEGALEIYDATREPGGEGDPKLKAQLAKMYRARGYFRYPALDDEGHEAMRLESGVGWRDSDFPGSVLYVQRAGSALDPVAATLDPVLVGWAQQMLGDNQFFADAAAKLQGGKFRSLVGLLPAPDAYELVRSQPPGGTRLPMSWDQPDFAWGDETDGVVAIKHGQEILYVSLYWRAGSGINSLARVHDLTPRYQQVAVVREDVKFDPSGEVFKRRDWINFGFGNGGTNIKYPADLHQAAEGEELPVAKSPPGFKGQSGNSHYDGRGEFYTLRYGAYLIAMNMTKDREYELKVPPEVRSAKELVSGKVLTPGGSVPVGPKTTVVLYVSSPSGSMPGTVGSR